MKFDSQPVVKPTEAKAQGAAVPSDPSIISLADIMSGSDDIDLGDSDDDSESKKGEKKIDVVKPEASANHER